MIKDTICDELDYRGFHIDFYDDDYGQQVYTIWQGKELGFGSYNLNYKDDMKYLIDRQLDVITQFPELREHHDIYATLEWYWNNGYRDICLKVRGRIIKVYPAPDEDDLETIALFTDKCIEDATKTLLKDKN